MTGRFSTTCMKLAVALIVVWSVGATFAPVTSAQSTGAGTNTTTTEGGSTGTLRAPGFSLGVLGPNVTLSNILIIQEGDVEYIEIRWIADLIGQLYKWAIGAAAVVAASMIMLGGFQYLTAGGGERVGAAKKRITDATVGLLLAVGSFLILNLVNESLTELGSLRLRTVERDPFEARLGTITSDTRTGGGGSSGPIAPGQWSPTMTECPVSMTTADTGGSRNAGARETEFVNAIRPLAQRISDARQRVLYVAEAATHCSVRVGSCGNNIGWFYWIAGIGSAGGCERHDCNGAQRSRSIWSTGYGRAREILYGWRCDYRGGTTPAPRTFVRQGIVPPGTTYPRPNCTTNGTEARTRVREFLQAEANAGRLRGVSNYPDEILDRLQPGDAIDYYNGNNDLTSSHAVIFLGWATDGKRAQVISGAWGRTPRAHTVCLRSSCGAQMSPIVGVYSAQ